MCVCVFLLTACYHSVPLGEGPKLESDHLKVTVTFSYTFLDQYQIKCIMIFMR